MNSQLMKLDRLTRY